ncbi:hypothetical protein HK101_005885, partial [Irineochytrium annulatum]
PRAKPAGPPFNPQGSAVLQASTAPAPKIAYAQYPPPAMQHQLPYAPQQQYAQHPSQSPPQQPYGQPPLQQYAQQQPQQYAQVPVPQQYTSSSVGFGTNHSSGGSEPTPSMGEPVLAGQQPQGVYYGQTNPYGQT